MSSCGFGNSRFPPGRGIGRDSIDDELPVKTRDKIVGSMVLKLAQLGDIRLAPVGGYGAHRLSSQHLHAVLPLAAAQSFRVRSNSTTLKNPSDSTRARAHRVFKHWAEKAREKFESEPAYCTFW
jgi:hypothetical protein